MGHQPQALRGRRGDLAEEPRELPVSFVVVPALAQVTGAPHLGLDGVQLHASALGLLLVALRRVQLAAVVAEPVGVGDLSAGEFVPVVQLRPEHAAEVFLDYEVGVKLLQGSGEYVPFDPAGRSRPEPIAAGKTVDAVERAIEDNVPVEFQQHAHHWLILHGRYICVARKPKCGACIIRDLCPFEEKTL